MAAQALADSRAAQKSKESEEVEERLEEFQIPDVDAIADMVLKWQKEDEYVMAAKEYLLKGQAPKDPSHQSWLGTVGQQLELDDYGILYRRCPDQQKLVIYVPDIAREVVVRESHVLPVGSHPSLQKTLA